MATKTPTIELGDRVQVKKTMNFNGRIGTVIPTSGQPDDFWDWYVRLEPNAALADQVIGVTLDQVELVDETPASHQEGTTHR